MKNLLNSNKTKEVAKNSVKVEHLHLAIQYACGTNHIVLMCFNSQFLRTTNQSGVYLLCSDCGRINAPDARFCDWCGKKVSKTSNSTITTFY